jgi:hypothetical protein
LLTAENNISFFLKYFLGSANSGLLREYSFRVAGVMAKGGIGNAGACSLPPEDMIFSRLGKSELTNYGRKITAVQYLPYFNKLAGWRHIVAAILVLRRTVLGNLLSPVLLCSNYRAQYSLFPGGAIEPNHQLSFIRYISAPTTATGSDAAYFRTKR